MPSLPPRHRQPGVTHIDRPAAPATPRRVILAVNPRASRVTPALVRSVERTLRASGRPVEAHVTTGPEQIGRLAAEAAEDGAVFAVLGGDGSVRAAATALEGSRTPLLIVPAGTGNLLAASLGLPRSPEAAARLLRHGAVRTIDLGAAEPDLAPARHFVVASGAGFDAAVMAATHPHHKGRFGVGAYFLTAARELASVRNVGFAITADGRRFECEAAAVLVANCLDNVFGLVRPRVPIAASDGRFDVFVVGARNGLDGLVSIARLLAAPIADPTLDGRSPGPATLRFRARELRIEANPPQPVELDGDLCLCPTPLTLRVLPRALRVVVRGRV